MNPQSSSSIRLKRALTVSGVLLAASAATLLAVRARAAGIPAANALTYTGYLETPDGTPLSTATEVAVAVWDAKKDGTRVCGADAQTVTPVAGRFQLALPDCLAAVGASPDLWLEATVDGTSLGRTKLGTVPYAVEANHASSADDAAEGSALQTQLTALQAGVDLSKARLDGGQAPKLAKSSGGTQVTVSNAAYAWVSGTDPAKLAAGRYWATTTGRTWAIGTASCTTACESAITYLAPCMKIGNAITMGDAEVVAEPPKSAVSLPFSTVDAFDLDKETANVQIGLCAKRSAAGMGLDSIVANVYSVVMAQPK